MDLDQYRITALSAPPQRIKGHEPLLLDDAKTLWVLLSGSLAIFSTAVESGRPEGARRHVFNVEPGELLFGTVGNLETDNRGLLAMAIEEAELQPLSQADAETHLASAPGDIVSGVEGWVSKFGHEFSRETPPEAAIQISEDSKYDLKPGECLEPARKAVRWVRLLSGTATWMGQDELTLSAATPPIPLASGMWLQAENPVELETLSTTDIADAGLLFRGLSHASNLFLHRIALLHRQEALTAFQQFQDEERLNLRKQQETLEHLASVLQPKRATSPSAAGPPLLAAARAVGAALGITIRPPAQSEVPGHAYDPLEAIARASHIRMRTVLLTEGWWKKDNGPLCAYTRADHRPVALLQTSATRYACFDPETSSHTPVDARFAARLRPVAYTFYRPFPDGPLNAGHLLKFGLQSYGKDLLWVLMCGIAVTLLGMLTPQMIAILIDRAIPDANRDMLLQIGLALLAAAFGQGLFQLAQGYALIRFQSGSGHATQAAIWDRLLKLKPAFFRQFAVGDLLLRVSAVSAIFEELSGSVMNTLFTSFLALLNLGLLFVYSPKLALVATTVAVVAILATTYSGYLTVRQVKPLQKLKGELFGIAVQLINGVDKLRVAGAEARAFAHWGERFVQQQRHLSRIQRIEDSIAVFNTVLPTLASAVIFWFAVLDRQGASATGQVGLTAGVFLAFNAAYGTFIQGATNLSNTIIDLLDVSTLFERAQPILQAEPEVDGDKVDPGRLLGKVALEHITFRYQADGPAVLDDVSIHAEPGAFIALVGPSGCGKSTMLRLLLGFDTPESGSVYYDDQDLARLDIYAVRRQLGTVLQFSKLTSASIYDNIASGSAITLDEAWEAARAAGFADEIRAMPMKMYTLVSEGGSNLSGGQRQRLLIAKALVLKPKIILFDEATSALDNRTQAIVSESLEKMRATRIVIAHRLSTIRNADRIYVIDQGRVVQQGSFDELAAQHGLFAQLMTRQNL